jgi:histidyl-tRNA synthetase
VDVYVVHQGELASQLAGKVAEQLRDDNLRVILHCGGGSFKAQMKKADASGAQVAVVIGDDEAQANEVSVKPMLGGEQVRVGTGQLTATINGIIK